MQEVFESLCPGHHESKTMRKNIVHYIAIDAIHIGPNFLYHFVHFFYTLKFIMKQIKSQTLPTQSALARNAEIWLNITFIYISQRLYICVSMYYPFPMDPSA